ncbi:protein phosphatase CheZ [Rhodoferax aquaticus]|uniref:Protein phosphatase CheZ n=1 Tax=Rhodoferax aquaticus TaxID=2527691 RepID=A0A515EM14_9BURK|nr:protein phosphatase CheZ [Rhodoferax aquaticus]QDL53710.1 protein phosphatase CheZ [Rhodoferax aquaticus]
MTDNTSSAAANGVDSTNSLMYEGLGHVVRALHDALTWVGADNALADASNEFPSARERLLHVATMTERAANTVLNKVDEASPLQQNMEASAKALAKQWEGVQTHGLSPEMQALVQQTQAFLSDTQFRTQATSAALSEIMMAQDFQDLTGQLIKKVATLIERTETDLIKLLISGAPEGKIASLKKEEELAGPGAVGSIRMAQNDVDAMLADLGF